MNGRRVVLVDDHALVVETLAAALADAGVTCTAVAPRPAGQLLAALISEEPSLVLLDLDLGPFGDSIPLIAPLTESDIRVVVLTAQTDRTRLGEAVEQGAIRIVPKTAQFAKLVATIRETTLADGVRRDPEAQALLLDLAAYRARAAAMRAPFDALTDREKQTLVELAQGRTVQQIASRWVVAETTVRSHVRAILTKLDARSQLQAVVHAVHAGWIDPEAEFDAAVNPVVNPAVGPAANAATPEARIRPCGPRHTAHGLPT
jgi:DNA-binding NarL/FixJ family response regulator